MVIFSRLSGRRNSGRPDARERRPDRGQRDYRDRRADDGWACGPRSGANDGRSALGGRQFETRYESQAFQHQPRSESMAERNSSARRGEPQRRYEEPWEWRHRDERQRRYDEPSRHYGEPQRRHLDEP